MIGWYLGLHPWNRISLTALLVLAMLSAALGTLTVERMLVTPLCAAGMWAFGWALIAAWGLVRKQRTRSEALSQGV